MEKLNLKVLKGCKELIIRQGNAPENFEERKQILVVGNIDVPYVHLSKPSKTLISEQELLMFRNLDDVIHESYLQIDIDKMCIKFHENAGKEYQSIYSGSLKMDTVFIDLGINDNSVSYTPFSLAEKIKRYRSFFESKTDAMKLVSVLRDFEAKVNKEVEAKADERANKRVLLAQTVTTNIPEAFKIKAPIFKGVDPVLFEVEISIDPTNLQCLLVSPDANDIILQKKNEVLKEQERKIGELWPDLRIFWI